MYRGARDVFVSTTSVVLKRRAARTTHIPAIAKGPLKLYLLRSELDFVTRIGTARCRRSKRDVTPAAR